MTVQLPGGAPQAGPFPVCIRPLCDEDRSSAARVYVAGMFDEEVRALMPRHPQRAESLFAELIRPGGESWVAEAGGGEVAGLALCHRAGTAAPIGADWRLLRSHLPPAASIRAWLVSRYMYGLHGGDGMLSLQSLVVEERWRGRGIGATLVDFVCEEARRRNLSGVSLYVVGGNERARSLYVRLGFQTVGRTPVRLYRPFVRWSTLECMEKQLR